MKKNKKIKNLTISIITFIFLSSHTHKLIKSDYKANNMINNHNSNHKENIVAHRGLSGLYNSNSYDSIKNALNLDCVDIIEIDLRLTKDKKIILSHDDYMYIDNKKIKVKDLVVSDLLKKNNIKNYQEFPLNDLLTTDFLFLYKRYLKKIPYNEEKIITLNNLLEWYTFQKPLILDIKTKTLDYDFMSLLDELLKKYKDLIYIQSDNYSFLEQMYKLYPDYRYLFIMNTFSDTKLSNNNFYGYVIKYNLLNYVRIEDDKLYFIYTINSSSMYLNLLKNNNYRDNMYIITNNPDYICSLYENKKLRK